ncbi:BaiN/RdsA family NAD(P)/FAD-dependent oxidoreductase [Flavicella sediminum]|uniref:NAD(P)/FAD-dependent oxidoreductase n=1 Tax=Flavicella sediminum TaxID=2585141 RepID=UPI00111D4DC2|nr:NAD(P)/FAD-dependent oxidoreductase [Flavicella sediminum]
MHKNVLIIGGGAAGFFTAITAKEKNANLSIAILEKGKEVLQKVKISGGGRCNVTHACFVPKDLCEFYPRGKKELLGPFHQFMTGDTMEWFETRGVPLKIEKDNRVFPQSNSSQSIIDCFQNSVDTLGIEVLKNHGVNAVSKNADVWEVVTTKGNLTCDQLVICAGSSKRVWELVKSLDHTVVEPVPSLFTFNIKDSRLTDLLGVSVPKATVKIVGTKLESSGPLLITHWGLSGPAILKLSAFGARILAEKNYEYQVEVNWLSKPLGQAVQELHKIKKANTKKQIALRSPFEAMSKRLWERLVTTCEVEPTSKWADLSNKKLEEIAAQLTKGVFKASGKSTFKEEFVTAGGIKLKEINFKRFESKIHENLFFAGEVLNIDAVTGGFNFQNAWTGGFVIGNALAENE